MLNGITKTSSWNCLSDNIIWICVLYNVEWNLLFKDWGTIKVIGLHYSRCTYYNVPINKLTYVSDGKVLLYPNWKLGARNVPDGKTAWLTDVKSASIYSDTFNARADKVWLESNSKWKTILLFASETYDLSERTNVRKIVDDSTESCVQFLLRQILSDLYQAKLWLDFIVHEPN